jgi:predicted dehydrogenase
LRVGVIGTGAIADLHARAYQAIGFTVRACTDVREEAARRFSETTGAEMLADYTAVCRHPEVDLVDLCTLPGVRLEVLQACAAFGKPIQVQKPIATTLEVARTMVDTAKRAGIVLGVVSQHRFDEACQFLARAVSAGRLGRLLQCDAYVKWYRSDAYYARPIKGSWAGEGGGALINQGIHQVDVLRWLAGAVSEVSAMWQLGGLHSIESEDVVNVLLRYALLRQVCGDLPAIRVIDMHLIAIHPKPNGKRALDHFHLSWLVVDDRKPGKLNRPHGRAVAGITDAGHENNIAIIDWFLG